MAPATNTAQDAILKQIQSLDSQIKAQQSILGSTGDARTQAQSNLRDDAAALARQNNSLAVSSNNTNANIASLKAQRDTARNSLIQSFGGDANLADQSIRDGRAVVVSSQPTKASAKSDSTKGSAKTTKSQFLHDRRQNFNLIGFDVAKFLDDIITEIGSKRVTVGSLGTNIIGTLDNEPRLNTFYRMVGLPVSGQKLQSNSKKSNKFDDLSTSISSHRSASFQDKIDRGIPNTSKRFLYPVVDGLLEVPLSRQVNNPFINTVIAIRINKYDTGSKPTGTKDSGASQSVEELIKRNINGLIKTFPRFLLRRIQQDARFRTISDRRNNNDANAVDGQSKANNGSFDISAVSAGGAATSLELQNSEFNQIKHVICEELSVENALLGLLPLKEVGRNVFSSPLLGMISHNRSSLDNILQQLKEVSERLLTAARKREFEVSLLEGVNLTFLPDPSTLATEIQNRLSGSISAMEVLAMLASLMEISENNLLILALNNGIPSSQDLSASELLKQFSAAQSQGETQAEQDDIKIENTDKLREKTSKESIQKALDELNKLINIKMKAFKTELDKSRSTVRDDELGHTISQVSQTINSAHVIITDATGKTQNTEKTKRFC